MDKVEFFYLPVDDLDRALRLYRDRLGWPEAWREGDTTASLKMPGDQVQLMLDQVSDGSFRPGPVVLVDDVKAWCEQRREVLEFWLQPDEIPGGYWAAFDDGFGNAVYVLDQSTADA
jgi:catechol 2,3-dioxygenase-like lactoylglutathione lyase family enzyme